MPRKCCVTGCHGNYKSRPGYVTCFTFPKENDKDRRSLWISAIGRPSYVIRKHSGVCIAHFTERDLIRSESFIDSNGILQTVQRKYPALTKDAVPSLALFPKKTRRRKALKETRAPQKARASPLNDTERGESDRMIRSDRLNCFNELQNTFETRLKSLIRDENWLIRLERDSYLLFYHISVIAETTTPAFTSVCVKNDLQVNVRAADRIVDRSQLRTLFAIRAGRLDRWSSLENLLRREQLPPASARSAAELVLAASERLSRAAQLLENDVNCGPSRALDHLSEQARLAITAPTSRRYSERLRRIACILYARSPECYRLVRRLHLLALPFDSSLKRPKRPPLTLQNDASLHLLPVHEHDQ